MIDTGGYTVNSDDIFEDDIRRQVMLAIDEADVILFSGGGVDGHHRPRHAHGRHPAPHHEEGHPGLQQSRQLRSDLLLARVLQARAGRPLLHLVDVGKRYGRPDGRHPEALRGGGGGGGGGGAETSAQYEDDLPRITIVGRPNVGKSSLTNAPAGCRAQYRDSCGRHHARLDPHALQQIRHGLLLGRHGRYAQEGQGDRGPRIYSVMRSIRAIENS